ncbi:MAG: hypothetical protein HN878_00525 [Candidatus Diapherotrites archaeon]|nr:hypothetical protein [Candidatus Diapherotrites archaeon]
MDFVNFLISIVILGVAIQFGELWIVLGAAAILIVASKDIKASVLYIITIGSLYFINSTGLKEYWLFALLGLIVLGYLMGLGNDAQPADPYAGLLGGDMGGMGM